MIFFSFEIMKNKKSLKKSTQHTAFFSFFLEGNNTRETASKFYCYNRRVISWRGKYFKVFCYNGNKIIKKNRKRKKITFTYLNQFHQKSPLVYSVLH